MGIIYTENNCNITSNDTGSVGANGNAILYPGQKMPSGDNMEAQEISSQGQDGLAGDVMEGLEEPRQAGEEVEKSNEAAGNENTNDPLYVQKRLKQQKRAHEREIRDLHARIGELQSVVHSSQPEHNQTNNPYDYQSNGGVDEQIHKAVSYALQHKEMEERKAKDAERAAHVQRRYQDLQKHLDSASDKYDDFDDVVRGQDAPFTTHMRDAAMLLPKKGDGSAAEVLYKLGKNPNELSRIAKLHPLEQAEEMVRLSHALIGGAEVKTPQNNRPLGQIKSTPVINSASITDKTPVSELRKRMKSGWK